MKRFRTSDSFGALLPIYGTEEERESGRVYSRELQIQSMLNVIDEDGFVGENSQLGEKKRRLSVDQVRALEKNFEIENKLEPERKVKLAQELGLQPRQVAVWFQNRRARWKTKQLERDYILLKSNYDTLKLDYETLQRDNESLLREILDLKTKLKGETREGEGGNPVEGSVVVSELRRPFLPGEDDLKFEVSEEARVSFKEEPVQAIADISDSDSSAVLQEENSSSAVNSSSGGLQSSPFMASSSTSSIRFSCPSFSPSSRAAQFEFPQKLYHPPQLARMEEQGFEPCSFFSDEQSTAIPWFSSDQWD